MPGKCCWYCCWLIDIADDDLESWLEEETDSRLEWGCCCGWGGRIPGSPEGWDIPGGSPAGKGGGGGKGSGGDLR